MKKITLMLIISVFFIFSSTTVFAETSGIKQSVYSSKKGIFIPSQEVGANGVLYITTNSKLVALNSNGSVKFEYPLVKGSNNSQVILGKDGVIYVMSNQIVALNPDGKEKWRSSANVSVGWISLKLSPDQQTIYVSNYHGLSGGGYDVNDGFKLFAINTTDGSIKWSVNGNYIILKVREGGTIYINEKKEFNKTVFLALNQDGTTKWQREYAEREYAEREFAEGVGATVASDGTLYYSSIEQKKIVALDSNGNEKWSFDVSADGYKGSARVTAVDDGVIVKKNNLVKLDTAGNVVWTIDKDIFLSPMALNSKNLLIAFEHNRGYNGIHFIDKSGNIKWSLQNGSLEGVSKDGQNIYATVKNVLSSYNAEDGSINWSVKLNDPNYAYMYNLAPDQGYVYVADNIGSLYKIRDSINIVINGSVQNYEQPPLIKNGSTLVPLRAIFETLGAKVEWNSETQSVKATKGNKTITLKIDSNTASVNEKQITLEQAPTIINDKTMVPVRFVTESFGGDVKWDSDTRTVNITAGK
ncbi:stalk domain-containing protein [Paenibacillus sp. GP183]|uniref:stalk domain-containing protein n=1 Tax=Paenibacillus sp. GP183 TaxID=1882751 RepID=UPI000897C5E9|nr:stalk domain-containing protein [Paenibacillus sp. GP183]SEC17752.1 Outer membrane protein assembly factor BamB, contains PQQ-like beta-propeller repeat [Paenibacillus sp. GP183]